MWPFDQNSCPLGILCLHNKIYFRIKSSSLFVQGILKRMFVRFFELVWLQKKDTARKTALRDLLPLALYVVFRDTLNLTPYRTFMLKMSDQSVAVSDVIIGVQMHS